MHAAGRDDPEPKALACYGLWLPERERMLLRFVAGRPVSAVTCAFLAWVAGRLAAEGVRVLALVWDNAPWHVSREVRAWIAAHNRRVKAATAAAAFWSAACRARARGSTRSSPSGCTASGPWSSRIASSPPRSFSSGCATTTAARSSEPLAQQAA